MKVFIVVSLICYLGAVSATLAPKAGSLAKAAECKHQAYLETLNCTKHGFDKGTAELECMSKTVVHYLTCIDNSPTSSITSRSLLGAAPPLTASAPLASSIFSIETLDKINCIFDKIVDTLKCIVQSYVTVVIPPVFWVKVTKCLMTKLPALLVCFPK